MKTSLITLLLILTASLLFLAFSIVKKQKMCITLNNYQQLLKNADLSIWKAYQKAKTDVTRPMYHLRPPGQWQNDPAAALLHNGRYHIFFQTNPYGSIWGAMSWTHIVNDPSHPYKWYYPIDQKDSIYKVTAIVPTPGQYDKKGVYSGSGGIYPFKTTTEDGKKIVQYYPTLFYSATWGGSGTPPQGIVSIARHNNPADLLLTDWEKYPSNDDPQAILKQPLDMKLFAMRDPYIFQKEPGDDHYYLMISAGILKKSQPYGVILLYHSTDLLNWNLVNKNQFFFENKVFVKDPVTKQGNFEMPLMYRLTDHNGTVGQHTPWILIFGQDGPTDNPIIKVFTICWVFQISKREFLNLYRNSKHKTGKTY
jgi:sucrose-6-phosphate hydrolase SacC (GH32 family)